MNNTSPIIVLLLITDSLHFVFAKMLLPYLPPTASAMYVLLVATVQVGGYMLIWDEIRVEVFRRQAWFFLSIGFLVGANTAMNYASVDFIDPGTASLLGHSTILFGMILGVVWLQDKLVRLEIMGAIVAIIGLAIISFQPGDYLRLGAMLVLISAFMYAFHAAIVKRYGSHLDIKDFFFFRLLCTSGFLLLFTVGQGQLVWPSGQAWLILLMTGTVDVTISRALYYIALQRLSLSIHSLILTFSPVVTIGWTLLLFGIAPTVQQLVGGVAVMGGLALLAMAHYQPKPIASAER